MKFLVDRASAYRSEKPPIPEAKQEGSICRFFPPDSDHADPSTAFYVEIATLADLQALVDREGAIVISPLPMDDVGGGRPYGARASYELRIYDDYME